MQPPEIDRTKLDAIIAQHKDEKWGLIPLLQDVQEEFGYIPPEFIEPIADALHIFPAQVTISGGGLADANRLVRQLNVHGIHVRLGIDRHGSDAQLLARTDDPNGNFPAIGYKDFFKHAVWPVSL